MINSDVRSHRLPRLRSAGALELALDRQRSRWTMLLVIRIGGAFILFIARIIGRARYLRPEHRNGERFGFELTRYPVGPGALGLIALCAGDRHQWPARRHANKIAAAQARNRRILRRGARLRIGGKGWSRQRRSKYKSERHCDCGRQHIAFQVGVPATATAMQRGDSLRCSSAACLAARRSRPGLQTFKAEPPVRPVRDSRAVLLLASTHIGSRVDRSH
jgi:hypothetical protein